MGPRGTRLLGIPSVQHGGGEADVICFLEHNLVSTNHTHSLVSIPELLKKSSCKSYWEPWPLQPHPTDPSGGLLLKVTW